MQKLLDMYYEQWGWDANGIPTEEKLEELGLSDLVKGFWRLFAPMSKQSTKTWLDNWQQNTLLPHPKDALSLCWQAILAGRVELQPVLARRLTIVEVLSDGRPHTRHDLLQAVEDRLGPGCFGKSPGQTLWADIRALRARDLRIGYSRGPGTEGYYLKYPPLGVLVKQGWEDSPNPVQIEIYRSMSNIRKMQAMFDLFEFVLHQAQVGTRWRHPDWSDEEIEAEARRLVTGVEQALEKA